MIAMNRIVSKICIVVIFISLFWSLALKSYAADSLPAENAGPEVLKNFFKNYETDEKSAKKFRKLGSEATSTRLQKYKATLEEKSGNIKGKGNLIESFKNYREQAITTGSISNRDYDDNNIREEEELYISGYAKAYNVSEDAQKFLKNYYKTYKKIVDLTKSVINLEKADTKKKKSTEKSDEWKK